MNYVVSILVLCTHIILSEIYLDVEKGIIKRIMLAVILTFEIVTTLFFHVEILGWIFVIMTLAFYFLCYAYNKIRDQLIYLLGIIIVLSFSFCLSSYYPEKPLLFFILVNGLTYTYILWLRQKQFSFILLGVCCSTIIMTYLTLLYPYPIDVALACLSFIMTAMYEAEYSKNASTYEKQRNTFQNDIMLHHYEEVQNVYLNMRGWRHDYHNHIQAIRAYLSFNQVSEASRYLQELELDLDRVDTLVKSGHLMIDAILNSKLTMALSKDIQIQCKVLVPQNLHIRDMDLCVLIGNLLDNAIEACMKIDQQERFIRVYLDTLKHQFYLSIVNSASEVITENERQYISEKRGNHGHGMKRVQLVVDKYQGYLNLNNETGVFACEVMIPLDHSCTK